MNTNVPGIKAKHAIVTSNCRATHGDEGAIDEALARLKTEALKAVANWPPEKSAEFHFVLTVDYARTHPRKPSNAFGEAVPEFVGKPDLAGATLARVAAAFEPVKDWYDGDGERDDLPAMIADAVADLQEDRKENLASRNYVADSEVYPRRIQFGNGRIVFLRYERGRVFLDVDMERPADDDPNKTQAAMSKRYRFGDTVCKTPAEPAEVPPPDILKTAQAVVLAWRYTPRESMELIDAMRALVKVCQPTIAETFEAVRAAGGEHKADCDCDRCVQARERNAAKPATPWKCLCGCSNRPNQVDCYSCGKPRIKYEVIPIAADQVEGCPENLPVWQCECGAKNHRRNDLGCWNCGLPCPSKFRSARINGA